MVSPEVFEVTEPSEVIMSELLEPDEVMSEPVEVVLPERPEGLIMLPERPERFFMSSWWTCGLNPPFWRAVWSNSLILIVSRASFKTLVQTIYENVFST